MFTRNIRRSLTLVLLGAVLLASACASQPEPAAQPPPDTTPQPAPAATPEPPPPSGPKVGGTLRVAASSDVQTTDPFEMKTWQSWEVFRSVLEGLVTVDESLSVVPNLASKWEVSADGLTYTFDLRPGVLFHNGKELMAEDVVYSLETFLNGSRATSLAGIDSVTAVGERAVAVTLKQVSATFLVDLAAPYLVPVVPKGLAAEQGGTITTPIGTGPFRFVEWEPQKHVRLARWDKYWGGGEGEPSGFAGRRQAYVDELNILVMPESATRVAALEAGEIDLTFIPAREYRRLSESEALQALSTGPSLESWNFWFNVSKGPFADKNLRLAFVHGIDRQEMLIATDDAQGAVATSPIHPSSAFFSAAHQLTYSHDVAKAKEYLAKSSYKGEPMEMLSFKGYTAMEKMALMAQAQLKEVGINLEVTFMDFPTLYKRFLDSDYEVSAMGYPAFLDPNPYFWTRMGPDAITNGWKDEAFNTAVDKARSALNFDERKALYDLAITRVYEEIPMFPTFFSAYYMGASNRTHGFEPWPANYARYWNVWVD